MLRRTALLILILAMTGCQNAPLATADPYPVWPTDGCGYFEASRGVHFYFRSGSAEPLNAENARRLLDHVLEGSQRDGGYLLLEAHIDGAEAASGRNRLDQRRADAIRQALMERGIHPDRIWIRTLGYTQPLVPAPIRSAEAQNRRVILRNTGVGRSCLTERRRERRAWFERNCFPDRRSDAEFCVRALRVLDQEAAGANEGQPAHR